MIHYKFFKSFSQLHAEKSGNLLCLIYKTRCFVIQKLWRFPLISRQNGKYSCITAFWGDTQGETI